MKEIWKDIVGYEGLYQVSNCGRIRSLHYNKTKIKKFVITRCGYARITLSKNNTNKIYSIHRLVAESFIPDKSKFKKMPNEDRNKIDIHTLQINHKDENKLNNSVNNLEWCTIAYNNNYGTRNNKISIKNSITKRGKHYSPKTEFKKGDNSKKIKCIDLNKIYNSISDASKELNIASSNIVNVCKKKEHFITAGGYHFEYL